MSTPPSASLKAMRQVFGIPFRGGELRMRKKGALALVEWATEHPVLVPFVEKLGDMQLAGGAEFKFDKASMKQAFKESLAASGMSQVKLALQIVRLLRTGVIELFADVIILAPGDTREDVEDLLNEADTTELLDLVGAFVKINLPVAYGPFVRAAAKARAEMEKLSGGLQPVAESSESETGSATSTALPEDRLPIAA